MFPIFKISFTPITIWRHLECVQRYKTHNSPSVTKISHRDVKVKSSEQISTSKFVSNEQGNNWYLYISTFFFAFRLSFYQYLDKVKYVFIIDLIKYSKYVIVSCNLIRDFLTLELITVITSKSNRSCCTRYDRVLVCTLIFYVWPNV